MTIIHESRPAGHFNPYATMMDEDFAPWVFSEEKAVENKGKWREKAFLASSQSPLDLEIGVGNGYYFAHYCASHHERNVVGLELKYKPLIQTIRRTLRGGAENGRMIRYDASFIDEIFSPGEIDNAFIFFPDPWPKKRHHKNRLLTIEFFMLLHELQKPGSFLEIKTDNVEYFRWICERVVRSPYKIEFKSEDLHQSEWAPKNFMTHFEKLWTGKGLKTHFLRLNR